MSCFVGPHFSCCGTCLVGLPCCGIVSVERIADFSIPYSSLTCSIERPPSELWKLYRRLGHMSFNFLCRLSGLGLIRGLLMLV
jgi:hypothetical protein